MKPLKYILLAAFALLGFGINSFGQGVQEPTLTFNVVTNGYTTAETIVIDTRKQENVALALVFSQTLATNVVPIVVTLKKSVDGINASDADTISWSHARSAVTTTQVATTNVNVAGYPYLILKSISAPGAASNLLTIDSFKYFVKFMSTR